jgi:hypothetical protein
MVAHMFHVIRYHSLIEYLESACATSLILPTALKNLEYVTKLSLFFASTLKASYILLYSCSVCNRLL